MQRIFPRIVSLLVTSAYFLGLLLVATTPFSAQAACNYTIMSFSGNKTSATAGDTINFTAQISRSGTLSDCSSSASASVGYNSNYTSGNVRFLLDQTKQLNFSQANPVSVTFSINLGSIDRSELPDPNKFVFSLGVHENGTFSSTLMTKSAPVTVSLTGSVTGTGTGSGQVYFQPANQSTYKEGDPIKIYYKLSSNDLAQFSGDTELRFEFKDGSRTLGSFTKKKSDIGSTDQYLSTSVTGAGGFTSGQNTITVSVSQTTAALKISEGTGTVVGDSTLPAPSGQSGNPGTGGTPGNPNTGGTPGNPGTGGTPGNPTVTFRNPLGSASGNLFQVFTRILKMMMGVLGALSVAMIIVGGFQMVLSQGNSEAYGKAKNTIIWAVMGLVIALLSFAIIAIIQNLLGADIPNPASFF